MDDKRLTVERWLIKAARDLLTSKTMFSTNESTTDVVCFHAQQCAEKSLKAFLVFIEHDFPKTHDLQNLLKLCASHDPSFVSLEDDARFLSDYAVEVRYVDGWRDIAADEASEAIARAENAVLFVKSKLNY